MAFVPSADSQKVLASGQPLADLLTAATNLNFKVSVPTSYVAVVEAMGSNQVDVGWLAPFAYVLAHDKNGSQVILTSLRQGSKTYRSQIIVRADSGINNIEQLRGKKFAFVDPASASGFLFPNAMLADMGIDYKTFFSDTIFAGGHDKVVIAVYNKQVDGGATFGNSIDTGPPTDARTLVTSTLPDVMTAVKPIATDGSDSERHRLGQQRTRPDAGQADHRWPAVRAEHARRQEGAERPVSDRRPRRRATTRTTTSIRTSGQGAEPRPGAADRSAKPKPSA